MLFSLVSQLKIKTNFHSKITSQNIVRKGHEQVIKLNSRYFCTNHVSIGGFTGLSFCQEGIISSLQFNPGKSLVKSKSCQDNIWKTFSNIDWWFWFDFPSAAAAVLCVISSQSSRQHSVWILFNNFVYFAIWHISETFLIENNQNYNTYLPTFLINLTWR